MFLSEYNLASIGWMVLEIAFLILRKKEFHFSTQMIYTWSQRKKQLSH